MERREKIQGFIKKYIILKKRKPTDSIFAEKRSAVAITFALMLPVFVLIFFGAIDLAFLYYAKELLSMGLDSASTFIASTSYENFFVEQPGSGEACDNMNQAGNVLAATYERPSTWGSLHLLDLGSANNIQILSPFTVNGGLIQTYGSAFLLLGQFSWIFPWSWYNFFNFSATSVVKFVHYGYLGCGEYQW